MLERTSFRSIGLADTHKVAGLTLLALLLVSCGDGGQSRSEALTQGLRAAGYDVQSGVVRAFRIEDCALLPSCFGNNATSPYGLWWLPPAPGTQPPTTEAMGLPPDDEGRSPGWALAADEAVVYLGRTSPEAAYFSYAPYVFSRVDAEGRRLPVFASVSDAVNLTRFGATPFDREIAVIITGDPALDALVRETLRDSGLADEDVVTFGLAPERVRFGTGAEADIVMMLQRFALFADPDAGAAYLDAMPAQVLRVTPRTAQSVTPFAPSERAARASGQNEGQLTEALDALEAVVRARHARDTVEPVPILSASTISLVLRSEGCLQNLGNCLGEISDTVYSAGPVSLAGGGGASEALFLTDTPGERIVAMGVNHAAFGRATYSNMVVMHSARLAGVAAMTSDEMRGSAAALRPDDPDAEYLFAVSIMRECGDEPYCLEVPTGFPGVDLDEALSFAFRAYVQPGASVSPAPRELLVERVLHVIPQAAR
ncbi:MAG: hypothetical protein R3B40_20700 [Polyangiales bacterium]